MTGCLWLAAGDPPSPSSMVEPLTEGSYTTSSADRFMILFTMSGRGSDDT